MSDGGINVSEQGDFGDVVLQLEHGTTMYQSRNVSEPVYWLPATVSRIPRHLLAVLPRWPLDLSHPR